MYAIGVNVGVKCEGVKDPTCTLRVHCGQFEALPIGSLLSLVHIRWKMLGRSQAWGSLVRLSLHTSTIDGGRGAQ